MIVDNWIAKTLEAMLQVRIPARSRESLGGNGAGNLRIVGASVPMSKVRSGRLSSYAGNTLHRSGVIRAWRVPRARHRGLRNIL